MSTITSIGNYLTRGLEASLINTPIEDGKLRYTMDTGRCYLDYLNENNEPKRVRITDVEFEYTESQILAMNNPVQNIYISKDTGKGFCNVNGVWKEIGGLTLSKAEASDDNDYVLWFSGIDGKDPLYSTGLKYNPSTNTMSVGHVIATSIKVGNMLITETVTEEMDHIIDFAFVGI